MQRKAVTKLKRNKERGFTKIPIKNKKEKIQWGRGITLDNISVQVILDNSKSLTKEREISYLEKHTIGKMKLSLNHAAS